MCCLVHVTIIKDQRHLGFRSDAILKLLFFGVRDFCGYILGVTSIFDYFYGLFL